MTCNLKQKYFINSHKGVTGIAILLLMASFNQWQNTTAWIYLALHGTYGILWVLKSWIFPDKRFEEKASVIYAAVIWGGLTLYWVSPWILTSQNVQAPAWYMGICISIFGMGLFLHFASDMQKYTALKLRPNHLITDGFWTMVRNPNYLGELLIYTGFGLLAMHWLPLVILLLFIAVEWVPNMRMKDRSLSRYPDFAQYKRRTKMFIPFLF